MTLAANDPLIGRLAFRLYRSLSEREARQYWPDEGEPETIKILSPWGAEFEVGRGDYIVNEIGKPDDRWCVQEELFAETYLEIRPGVYIKKATTEMAPLTAITHGDEDAEVTLETLEGPVSVRAGDYYLARGVKGEIWPYPLDKIGSAMAPVQE